MEKCKTLKFKDSGQKTNTWSAIYENKMNMMTQIFKAIAMKPVSDYSPLPTMPAKKNVEKKNVKRKTTRASNTKFEPESDWKGYTGTHLSRPRSKALDLGQNQISDAEPLLFITLVSYLPPARRHCSGTTTRTLIKGTLFLANCTPQA